MNPINMAELMDIFGERMPVTAWAIIEHALNPDDARKQLRELKDKMDLRERNIQEGY